MNGFKLSSFEKVTLSFSMDGMAVEVYANTVPIRNREIGRFFLELLVVNSAAYVSSLVITFAN